jgi:hypothetical protein
MTWLALSVRPCLRFLRGGGDSLEVDAARLGASDLAHTIGAGFP